MSGPQVTSTEDGRVLIMRGELVIALPAVEVELFDVRWRRAMKERRQQTAPASKPEGMSEYHRRYLHALLGELGHYGDDRFPALSHILGRDIGSTNDLSSADAERCISALRDQIAYSNGPEHERTTR